MKKKRRKKPLVTNWDVEENHFVMLSSNGKDAGEITLGELLEFYAENHPKAKFRI